MAEPFSASLQAALAALAKWLDLLVMKAVAHRPKDIEDIRGLLTAHPQMDVSESRRWVKEFATAMSMSDILEEFDKLLTQRNS